MPRTPAERRAYDSGWNSHSSPAYQFNAGQPTGSASSQLSHLTRLNAGLSGPLAFQSDHSHIPDLLPSASADVSADIESDFPHEPTSAASATQLQANQADIADLNRRLQSLDLRVRVLEAERSGAQQALWHYHRAARDSQRLRSLISPWAFMSAKLDLIRSRVSLTFTRLENLLTTLQQAWPGCAAYFTPAALDVPNYQGPDWAASETDA